MARVAPPLLVALVLAACGAGNGPPGTSKGALVSFEMCVVPDGGPQRLKVLATHESFIREAERLADAGTRRVPVLDLRAGSGADPQWSWHVDPDTGTFADVGAAVCDGCPADVEADTSAWLRLGWFCPWSARVARVVRTP